MSCLSGSAAPPSDVELVQAIAAGDSQALETLYQRYAAALSGFAHRLCRDATLAEEAAQDTFIQVWRTALTYQVGRGSVRTWLFTITRTRALDLLRTRQRITRLADGLERAEQSATDRSACPERSTIASDYSGVLRCLTDALGPAQRQLVDLAYRKGLTHQAIAETTGQPLGTVKTHIRQVLQLMRAATDDAREEQAFRWRQDVSPSDSRQPPLQGLRVLVVDDDGPTVQLLTMVLQRAGATVIPTASAAQAVARLNDFLPDVILADLSMPGQTGFDFFSQVRQGPAAAVPVVAFSAHQGVADRQRTARAGFTLHIGKPIKPSALVQNLSDLLQGSTPTCA